jgi:hypothetical protein
MLDIIIHDALMAAVTFAIAALGKLLIDPKTLSVVESLAAKLSAETDNALAAAEASHNALLQAGVHAAMVYAENHEDVVLKLFDSKANYVIASIQADPRFSHLNLPLDALKQLIEQLYQAYFADLKAYGSAPIHKNIGSATGKPNPTPADNTGGPGGKDIPAPVLK